MNRPPAGEVRLGYKSGGGGGTRRRTTCMSGPGHVRASNYSTVFAGV